MQSCNFVVITNKATIICQIMQHLNSSPPLCWFTSHSAFSNFMQKSVVFQNMANPSMFPLPNRVQYLPVFVYSYIDTFIYWIVLQCKIVYKIVYWLFELCTILCVIFRSSMYCTDVRLSCHNKRILLLLLLLFIQSQYSNSNAIG